jgi:nitroreductase
MGLHGRVAVGRSPGATYPYIEITSLVSHPQDNPAATGTDTLDATMRGRRSVRAFLPTPVSQAQVAAVLDLASCSPSGSNTQPWQVIALAGAARQQLCERVQHAYHHEPGQHLPEYDIYPAEFVEPYLSRRRKNGMDLYGLLGITKGDKAAMQDQTARNFSFFDAPVGLIFIVDRRMTRSSWIDYGMFLQNIMLAARARGLDTCPQVAWALYPGILAETLKIPDRHMVVCGMALGYADPEAVENRLRTEREPMENFTRFSGF